MTTKSSLFPSTHYLKLPDNGIVQQHIQHIVHKSYISYHQYDARTTPECRLVPRDRNPSLQHLEPGMS